MSILISITFSGLTVTKQLTFVGRNDHANPNKITFIRNSNPGIHVLTNYIKSINPWMFQNKV